jgi:hypothetical protein
LILDEEERAMIAIEEEDEKAKVRVIPTHWEIEYRK